MDVPKTTEWGSLMENLILAFNFCQFDIMFFCRLVGFASLLTIIIDFSVEQKEWPTNHGWATELITLRPLSMRTLCAKSNFCAGYLSNLRYCTHVHFTSHFIQGTRKHGHVKLVTLYVINYCWPLACWRPWGCPRRRRRRGLRTTLVG